MQNDGASNTVEKKAIVVGGGPAGLMAAEVLSQKGIEVNLFEAKPGIGRKFLVAGIGGLNITHSEPFEEFLVRYGVRMKNLKPILEQFGPDELQDWMHDLGFNTFIGTSGRVFPEGLNSAPILRAWKQRLTQNGVQFFFRHRWLGWGEDGSYLFQNPNGNIQVDGEVLILALGGGSRPELGSDGNWVPMLANKGVQIHPFKPANCGFNTPWSEVFKSKFEGQPVKNVVLIFKDQNKEEQSQAGEFLITNYGVEGSLIYAISSFLRNEIDEYGKATVYLDLLPERSLNSLVERLMRPRGKNSMSSHLRKSIGLTGVKAGLVREILSQDVFNDPHRLAASIKLLPLVLDSTRPLAEAISCAGGVAFESLNEGLMIRNLPGVFCAGEMLDWEAPTGGYLLTACFATGYHAGISALKFLMNNPSFQR
jgi:uncharacterized flavoprotein (TIGR03862 family)